MISNISNNARGNASLKLVIGIVLGILLVGVGYGMFYQSSNSSKSDSAATVKIEPQKKVFYSIESQPQAEPEPQQPQPSMAETQQPPPKTIATAEPVAPLIEEPEPEETLQEIDEISAEEEYDRELFEERLMGLQSLRDALPNNSLIPYERTQEEIEEMVAIGEEINAIGESIEDNSASLEDRQRYFDAVSKQFDDQIELINFCNEKMSDPNSDVPLELCSEITANSDEQIEKIKGAKEALRKEIMQEK